MSAEATAIALHHSRAKGTAKIVLIGIANHDGDGGAWPAIKTLMKYANADRRSVQRAIDTLVSLGEVQRVIQGGGVASTADERRPNLYRITLRCPASCDRSTQHRTSISDPIFDVSELSTRAALTPRGGGADAAPGAALTPPGGAALTPPEPSLELTTQDLETNPSDRARPICLATRSKNLPHRELESGYCADCGVRVADQQRGSA